MLLELDHIQLYPLEAPMGNVIASLDRELTLPRDKRNLGLRLAFQSDPEVGHANWGWSQFERAPL